MTSCKDCSSRIVWTSEIGDMKKCKFILCSFRPKLKMTPKTIPKWCPKKTSYAVKGASMDETILEIIGSFVVAIILIAIPICVTLSFVYDWYDGIKTFLVIASFLELLGLVDLIMKHNY